jgi:hypothetical protein
MALELTTPALLFPAISLLLLAYTSRFLALANLVRSLAPRPSGDVDGAIIGQIANLRRRIAIIRWMQGLGVLSFFFCVLCMLLLFLGWLLAGKLVFATSLVLLLASLALSVREVQISSEAIDIHLRELERPATQALARRSGEHDA